MARNIKPKQKSMTLNELAEALDMFLERLTMDKIKEELSSSFPQDQIEGLDNLLKRGIHDLLLWLKKS